MRLVIFSEEDFEPMTIVDFPAMILNREIRSGDIVRLMPRLKMPYWATPLDDPVVLEPLRAVTVRLELLRRHGYQQESSTWIGFARDDGLTLKSSLLPGQVADYQWEFVS